MATATPPPPPGRPPLRLPTLRDIAHQVKSDLFGKDVQDNPTVSYEWIADQFGHFALGFEITFALTWILRLLGVTGPWLLAAPTANFVVFVIKELHDFADAKRKALTSGSDFKFNAGDIRWNMITALFYILLGIVVAGLSLLGPGPPLVAVLVSFVPAIAIGVWWLTRKITFQRANLPCLYRLPIFPNYLGDPSETAANVEFINAFIDLERGKGRHLVISGPARTGKSTLATGIGTEFAFKTGIGRYTTLIKILESIPVENHGTEAPTEFQDGRTLWPWDRADLLIVDDVDYVSDLGARIASEATGGASDLENHTTRIEAAIRRRISDPILTDLRGRRSVWVVGDGAPPRDWLAMIARLLGITDASSIRLIDLKMTISEAIESKGATLKASHPALVECHLR